MCWKLIRFDFFNGCHGLYLGSTDGWFVFLGAQHVNVNNTCSPAKNKPWYQDWQSDTQPSINRRFTKTPDLEGLEYLYLSISFYISVYKSGWASLLEICEEPLESKGWK